jgi:proteic killer suppression protein
MSGINLSVDVFYADRKLAAVCASMAKMTRAFGAVRARRVAMRLQQLRVAETLAELRLATGRCHELTEDRKGCVALDLDGPYRLVFEPVEWVADVRGHLDWSAVRAVVVLEIVDYH